MITRVHRPRPRFVDLHDGPLDGSTVRIYREPGGAEPPTVTFCYGGTSDAPWPHRWATYHRHPDHTYRWSAPRPPQPGDPK